MKELDVAKGIAMVLVVIGHALIGVSAALGETYLSRWLVILIYTTHMPLFFALSGAFAGRARAIGATAFCGRIVRRIVWPYLFWSVILLAAHFSMGEQTNTQVIAFRPWQILWRPPSVMWFLYVLFFSQVLWFLIQRFGSHWRVLVGAAFLVYPYFGPEQFLNARFVGLFLLASLLPLERIPKAVDLLLPSALVVLFLTCVIVGVDGQQQVIGYPASAPVYLPMVLAGPVVLVALSQRIGNWAIGRVFGWIGIETMPIFLTHILFTAGTRIVLVEFGYTDFWWVFLAASVAGIIGPLAVVSIARKLHLSGVLGWGRSATAKNCYWKNPHSDRNPNHTAS